MINETVLSAALAAAGRGWPVFLLGRTKRPVANCAACQPGAHDPQTCTCLTCHGFYAATTDPDRIAGMITTVGSGQLAVRCGAASGLVVIDVDPAHGGGESLERLVAAGLVPPTAYVITGSGGLHLYYRHPGQRVPSRPLPDHPGIDIKADGGYVVLPPAVHPRTGRAYRWAADRRDVEEMPPALVEACRMPTTPPPVEPTTTSAERTTVTLRGAGGISHPEKLLAAILAKVETAEEGKRRTTLYGAARGVARMIAAGALDHAAGVAALTEAGREAEQTEREIRNAIAGGFRDEGLSAA
jgi:hypothetical protein